MTEWNDLVTGQVKRIEGEKEEHDDQISEFGQLFKWWVSLQEGGEKKEFKRSEVLGLGSWFNSGIIPREMRQEQFSACWDPAAIRTTKRRDPAASAGCPIFQEQWNPNLHLPNLMRGRTLLSLAPEFASCSSCPCSQVFWLRISQHLPQDLILFH